MTRYTITIEVSNETRGLPPPAVRVRRLLKCLGRRFNVRCVAIRESTKATG
jgi:hypothetical protein